MITASENRHPRPKPATTGALPDATVILDCAPLGYCLLEQDGCIRHVNAAFSKALALPPEAILGEHILRFVHGQDAGTLTASMADIGADANRIGQHQLRLTQPDGSERWVMASFSQMTGPPPWIILQTQSIDDLKQAVTSLQKSETRWKYALESAHQGVWDHDFSANDLFYSIPWKKIRGMAADATVDGALDVWIETVHPADREHVLECIRRQDEGEVAFNTFQYRERHADGHWVWIESRGASVEWSAEGKPSRIIGTDTDISERKKAEAQLEEISRRLRLALDVSKVGVFEANLDTGAVMRDKQLLSIYGLDPLAPAVAAFEERLHPEDRDAALARVAAGVASTVPFMNAFRIIRPDGEIRHIRSSSVTFTDNEGVHKLIGANWDVTEDVTLREDLERARQLAEARNLELEAARTRIEYNALHDHLTGLPNRRFLDLRLDEWIAETVAYCAILHIDLDRFKQINDTLGHQAGDAMLVHTAQVLSSIIGDRDFVARIGGDEFLVLCDARHSQDEVILLTDQIIEALRQPVSYEGHSCRFGASVGIAWTAGGTADAKQSLMNADIALYRAKGLGRNRYEFFTKQLQTQIHHAKRTADEIIKGLEDREFVPFYQPQFDARTLDIAGVETLARWVHPRHGLLAPDYFLKIAEDINALTAIDRCIAEQALSDFDRWEGQDFAVPRISVNVSSRRLRDPGLIDSLRQLNIPRGKLSFELLESIFLDDLDKDSSQILSDLGALGIDIEIDDFGTGHASIVGLMKLNPSRLKIDRALVRPIIEAAEQRKLVGSIIDIGHSLNIEVVAEGVETIRHAHILRDLGCDTLQGYAFARPMPRTELEAFLRSGSWRPPETPIDAMHRMVRRDSKA
ncbi:EAL domain-containing protein [Pararhizobium sp. YC-54]|uniref:sensor domain-containing protein n=1 Tax=Pararhizobium sp. YC-54 TaxID=2986920 RepID=UPI0021F7F492|nr:bifunctional diguanylate cyclase/phosphodiesterase [Pararhizobium sp. YC-54]MCV9996913.1 EAL domain-containing protein [Pararhizobium sp. YC-54]